MVVSLKLKAILRSVFFVDDFFVDDRLRIEQGTIEQTHEQTQRALEGNSARRLIRGDAADERHHCRWHLRSLGVLPVCTAVGPLAPSHNEVLLLGVLALLG